MIPLDQRLRFERTKKGKKEAGVMMKPIAWMKIICGHSEYGMPPAAGEGIGIDRLVMLLTDPALQFPRSNSLFPLLRP